MLPVNMRYTVGGDDLVHFVISTARS